ncbi:MAG: cytidine deaminase [Verrucomicrobiota bacterium]
MGKVNRNQLMSAALKARERACAPYSKFKVGAALLTVSGKIIPGANVESASYGLTCCAERVALFRALTSGEKDFSAIAVTARLKGGAMPCGACRQLLAEYAPTAVVWVSDSAQPKEVREYNVMDLLPGAFRDFRPPSI